MKNQSTLESIARLEAELEELKQSIIAEEKPKFKAGDVVYHSEGGGSWIFILKKYGKDAMYIYSCLGIVNKDLDINNDFYLSRTNDTNCRLATPEEKQTLLDAMHKEGKDFDFDKLEVVEWRWRAENGCKYGSISREGLFSKYTDMRSGFSDFQHKIGNYFPPTDEGKKQAEEYKQWLLNNPYRPNK